MIATATVCASFHLIQYMCMCAYKWHNLKCKTRNGNCVTYEHFAKCVQELCFSGTSTHYRKCCKLLQTRCRMLSACIPNQNFVSTSLYKAVNTLDLHAIAFNFVNYEIFMRQALHKWCHYTFRRTLCEAPRAQRWLLSCALIHVRTLTIKSCLFMCASNFYFVDFSRENLMQEFLF